MIFHDGVLLGQRSLGRRQRELPAHDDWIIVAEANLFWAGRPLKGSKKPSCVEGRVFRTEGGSTKLVDESDLNNNYACI